MRYYENKKTGEIMASYHNLRDVILPTDNNHIKLGWVDYKIMVVTDVILPNKILGNGIITYCMPYTFIRDNYKRIKKAKAFERYPNLHQYTYQDLPKTTHDERLEILKKQTL